MFKIQNREKPGKQYFLWSAICSGRNSYFPVLRYMRKQMFDLEWEYPNIQFCPVFHKTNVHGVLQDKKLCFFFFFKYTHPKMLEAGRYRLSDLQLDRGTNIVLDEQKIRNQPRPLLTPSHHRPKRENQVHVWKGWQVRLSSQKARYKKGENPLMVKSRTASKESKQQFLRKENQSSIPQSNKEQMGKNMGILHRKS